MYEFTCWLAATWAAFPLISTFSAGMKKNLLHFFLFLASRSSTAANEQRAARAMECVKNASRLHEKLQQHTPTNTKKETKAFPRNALFF
jgi:hypothetical protein